LIEFPKKHYFNDVRYFALTVFFLIPFFGKAVADNHHSNPFEGAKIEVLSYIDYSSGKLPLSSGADTSFNKFKLTRGYFTYKKAPLPWLGMRVTMDVHQDETGDIKFREKYLYAELRYEGIGPFTDIKSEIGLGHIPWLDFEEHINPFRCQGTMAIERAGVLNSADLGISVRGSLGGKLDDAKAKTGNGHYSGKYGSWHIGVYNGGGYHAPENNTDKLFETRLTIRPLSSSLPGLQVSYLGIFGEGNKFSSALNDYPDYSVNLGMVSFEHPYLIFTGQYFRTKGNSKGSWIAPSGKSLSTVGYSLFGSIKAFDSEKRFSIFGRYDNFNADADKIIADQGGYTMIIGGIAYNLYEGNLILLDYEKTNYQTDSAGKGKTPSAGADLGDDYRIQIVYQIKL